MLLSLLLRCVVVGGVDCGVDVDNVVAVVYADCAVVGGVLVYIGIVDVDVVDVCGV